MRKKAKRGMSPVVRTSMTCSLKENGREFVLVVPCRRKPDAIHIDDKPYTELLKSRCDYAIEVFHDEPKRAFFFVELKGEDVLKAAEQLVYTAEHLQSYSHLMDYKPYTMRFACIVAAHGMVPSITTRYQACQKHLERCGFANLKCKTRKMIVEMDADNNVKLF